MSNDPFSAPAPIASEFATASSFRGRLVLITPTRLEWDVPNQNDPSKVADKLTADVMTVDGAGPVPLYAGQTPTGKVLEGPEHKGIWFSQERIVRAVCPDRVVTPGRRVLARMDTFKPGKPAGIGNPWGLINPTEDDMQTAREFLANYTVNQAAAPAAEENPFGGGAPF